MPAEVAILVWLGLATVLGLNGVAAGVVAILHLWGRRGPRGGKVFLASAVSAFLPASMMIAIGVSEPGGLTDEAPIIAILGFTLILGVATVLALPGALVVSRKFDSPGDAHRAFE